MGNIKREFRGGGRSEVVIIALEFRGEPQMERECVAEIRQGGISRRLRIQYKKEIHVQQRSAIPLRKQRDVLGFSACLKMVNC